MHLEESNIQAACSRVSTRSIDPSSQLANSTVLIKSRGRSALSQLQSTYWSAAHVKATTARKARLPDLLIDSYTCVIFYASTLPCMGREPVPDKTPSDFLSGGVHRTIQSRRLRLVGKRVKIYYNTADLYSGYRVSSVRLSVDIGAGVSQRRTPT